MFHLRIRGKMVEKLNKVNQAKETMPLNNKGLSLVEMIVVVAILVILSAATALGISAVSGKPAEQCITELKTAIDSNRTVSLGKKDAQLVISKQSDGIHVTESYTQSSSPVVNDRIIAPASVDLSFSTDGSTYSMVDASGITIEFDRSSGSVKYYANDLFFNAEKAGKSYKMQLYQLTGKTAFN